MGVHSSEEKLGLYMALLRKWQASVNLVGPATLGEAAHRHFDDSRQLADLIPPASSFGSGPALCDDGKIRLFDLGSGAGFPGMVLAMVRPDLDVTLIESDHKKCTFLSTVSRETQTPVHIVNQRIENVSRETIPAVITARALASLDKLCGYCLPWAAENPALVMLFLKGEKAQTEIDEARKSYDFTAESIRSRTAADGVIIKLADLSRKTVC